MTKKEADFIRACRIGDVNTIRRRLSNKEVNVSIISDYDIKEIIKQGKYEVAEILLSNENMSEDRINSILRNFEGFHWGLATKNKQMVKLLLRYNKESHTEILNKFSTFKNLLTECITELREETIDDTLGDS